MTRRFITIAAAAIAALALAACGSSSNNSTSTAAAPAASDTAAATDTAAAGGATGTLTGTVGPGFTISMDKTTVPAGKYTLTVDDQASSHNFHLTGAGVDVSTTVPEMGKKTFEITLTAGTYKFQCDPHAAQMNGTLTVT
jgi:plastocyanin